MSPKGIREEAEARTVIDLGVGIFRGVILAIIVFPFAAIFKAEAESKEGMNVFEALQNMPEGTYLLLLSFISVGLLVGGMLRDAGIRRLEKVYQKHKT